MNDHYLWWLFVFTLVVIVAGPLRRSILRQWRFAVPALVAGVLSFTVMGGAMKLKGPCWMPWALCFMAAMGAGITFKRLFDDVFGKDK